MAEFKSLDEVAFKKAGARGRKTYSTPRAVSARFDRRSHRVMIALNTGITFAFDPAEAPELRGVAPNDLIGVTVEGVGSTIHFPRLDADFTVSVLLEGFLGPLDWTRREMRAMASRENGRRGGRPRKIDPAPVSERVA